MRKIISVVVFDADDTLWRGLDGGYISGTTYQDEGRADYTFQKVGEDLILRSDGQRFELFPDVRAVLKRLEALGVVISIASYNVARPTFAALESFALSGIFRHPVVEWSSRKDRMITKILSHLEQEGLNVGPPTTLFVDDDHHGVYRGQMKTLGVNFLQKGVDIPDLISILDYPELVFQPPVPLDKVPNNT